MCKQEQPQPSMGRSLLHRLHKSAAIHPKSAQSGPRFWLHANVLPVSPRSAVVKTVKLLSPAPWYKQLHRHAAVGILAVVANFIDFADEHAFRNLAALALLWTLFEAYLLSHPESGLAISLRFHSASVFGASSVLISVDSAHGSSAQALLNLNDDAEGLFQGRKWFSFRGVRYVYNGEKRCFELDYPVSERFAMYLGQRGIGTSELQMAEKRWGLNVVRWPTPSLSTILWEYLTKPHFVFTILLIILAAVNRIILARVDTALEWLWHIYLGPTLGICALIRLQIHNAFEKRVNALEKEMRICQDEDIPVEAMRDGKWTSVPAEKLFPYDLVKLKRSTKHVPCDGVLLKGMVTVSEALITGESANIHKMPICDVQDQPMDLTKSSSHLRDYFLYGGSKIGSATGLFDEDAGSGREVVEKVSQKGQAGSEVGRYGPVAESSKCADGAEKEPEADEDGEGYGVMFVLKTGNATRKGEEFAATDTTDFYKEGFQALLWPMALFAAMNAIRILSDLYKYWTGIYDIAPWALGSLLLQSLLASVPWPVLYVYEMDLRAAATALFNRFRIVCIDHNRIPQAARLDVCCFDKTGTLTTARMRVHALSLPSNQRRTWHIRASNKEPFHEVGPEDAPFETKLVLAACHSLVGPHATGDPKEEAMFEALPRSKMTSLRHVELGEDNMEIEILSKFPFESVKAYMSAVVRVQKQDKGNRPSAKCFVLVKGKAEKVRNCLEKPPKSYDHELRRLSGRGFHVWALAVKEIDEAMVEPGACSREELEQGMRFAGFLMMQNELRFDTISTLTALKDTGHELKMITGDHILTAAHVALTTGIAAKEKLMILDVPEDRRKPARILSLSDFVNQAPSAAPKRRWNKLLKNQSSSNSKKSGFGEVVADAELPRIISRIDVAMDGSSLDNLHLRFSTQQHLIDLMCRHVKVFARVLPAQKEQIIASIKAQGLKCLMCGDGLNDVRALGRADIGVSISTVQGPQQPQADSPPRSGLLADWVAWIRPPLDAAASVLRALRSARWKKVCSGLRGGCRWLLTVAGSVRSMQRKVWKVGLARYVEGVVGRQEVEAEKLAAKRAVAEVTDVESVTMVVKSAHFKLFGSIGGIRWIVQSGRLSAATLLYKYNSFLLMKYLGVLNNVLFSFSMIRLVFLTSIAQILVKDVLDISAIIKRFKGNDDFRGPAPVRVESWLNVRYLFMQAFVQASTYVGLKVIIESIPAHEFPEMPDYVRPWSAAVAPSIPNAIFFYTWVCARFNTRFAIFPDQYLDSAGTYSAMVVMLVFVFAAIFGSSLLRLKAFTWVYAAITGALLAWNTIATWMIEKRWKRRELKRRLEDFEFDLKHPA